MKAPRLWRVGHEGTPRLVVERDGEWRLADGDSLSNWHEGSAIAPPEPTTWLAPVGPSKIVCIGLNYRDHAAERGRPLPAAPMVFLKPSTAVIGPGEPIRIPRGVGRVDHEAELGVVIGRRATRVPRREALDHVLGYTAVNDVTARDLQNQGVQYSHCKGYDTFAPLGPAILLTRDLGEVAVEGLVHGDRRQHSTTRELIFPVDELIEYISGIMTLLPGDVIATGTPAGIGPLVPGDVVTVRIDGIGELTNPVVDGGGVGREAAAPVARGSTR